MISKMRAQKEIKMTDKLSLEEQKEKLSEIKMNLRQDKLTIKPCFISILANI